MAQLTYRANLSAKIFPMLMANWGRTVIVPQYDQTFNRELSPQEDEDRDVGIPQIYYCHNVLPTAQGFQSIGYSEVIPAYSGLFTTPLKEVFMLPTVDSERVFLGINNNEGYYWKDGTWQFSHTYSTDAVITVAAVSGGIYFGSYGQGVYRYNSLSLIPDTVTLSGVNTDMFAGITSAAGYMILWTRALGAKAVAGTATVGSPIVTGLDTTVDIYAGQPIVSAAFATDTSILTVDSPTQVTMTSNSLINGTIGFIRSEIPSQVVWSSTIDPTDFVPSVITGAGGGALEMAKGEVKHCIPHTLGFFVFTSRNIVAALYSGNARYPFNFREIVNSGGLTSASRVAADANSGNIYAYTSSGIQMINSTQAITIFPEVTDFLGGTLMEDFNESTNTFTSMQLADLMQVRMNVVADRYLVISYGISAYTHALVYDISTKRWGKLKHTHIKCVEDTPDGSLPVSFSKKSILFFTAEGKASRWVFDTSSSSSIGVILLGKYQYVRSRLLQLDEVNVEQIQELAPLNVWSYAALDGRNGIPVLGYLLDNLSGFRKYLFSSVGINHSLLFKGAFNIVSLVLTFSIHGKR